MEGKERTISRTCLEGGENLIYEHFLKCLTAVLR